MIHFGHICLGMAVIILVLGCNQPNQNQEEKPLPSPIEKDLPAIKQEGFLRVLMSYSSTNYFIYRGRPMGFEYELLDLLAQDLNLELDIILVSDLGEFFRKLNLGEGDIIAHGLSITKARKKIVSFSNHHTLTKQVLVQKKPGNWRNLKIHEIEKKLIRNPIELIGKPVHVRKNSSYHQRLKNLSDEIGGDINIQIEPGHMSSETLIRQVSKGLIPYTVADHNIAALSATYLPNLDVKTAVSFSQRIAWAVRKNSPELKDSIDLWLVKIKKTPLYNVIYNRYFHNPKAHIRRMESRFFSPSGGKLSPYDSLIQSHANSLGWDWRLLAALVYQESHFDPTERSWAGAMGLMQLMPETGAQYGLEDFFNPVKNLAAGTAHLKYLSGLWEAIPDSLDRIKFTMASYNVGEGHLQDAQRLTVKYGGNPLSWENVSLYLLGKSKAKYYNDPVVRYGYCRGQEPIHYVDETFNRYRHYARNFPLQNKSQIDSIPSSQFMDSLK